MKFTMTKHGLKHDPRGAHVTMSWQGRELLGQVRGCSRHAVTGNVILDVSYLCGDPWPLQPTALSVDVLERN